MKINTKKCELCCSSLRHLGPMVTIEGIQTGREKYQAVQEDQRRFLRITSWYRRLLPNFAQLLLVRTSTNHPSFKRTRAMKAQGL